MKQTFLKRLLSGIRSPKVIAAGARQCLLTAACGILAVTPAFATETYYSYNTNHQGYSIAEGHPLPGANDVVVMAGSSCHAPQDCKILVQAVDRTNGAVQWRMEYDITPEAERCFKIIKSAGGYILTGFVYANPATRHTFVMEINQFGGVNWSHIYYDMSSVGLDVIECSDGSGYIVAGFTEDMGQNTGYAMKIDPGGNFLWSILFDSVITGQYDFDMAEHILEVPGSAVPASPTNSCYYITGSVNDPGSGDQKVLSLMLDDNGGIMWQQSFASSWPERETGVSSYYDANLNTILLVSNASNRHGFDISEIDPASGTVLNHRYFHTTTLTPICKLAAFQILEKNSDSVTIVGYVHEYPWQATAADNVLFAMDIEKSTLSPGPIHVFETNTPGYSQYFADWLGTPHIGGGGGALGGGSPLIHTPAVAYKDNDDNIWMVSYKQGADGGMNYDLALLKLRHSSYAGACDPFIDEPATGGGSVVPISLFFGSYRWQDVISVSETQPSYTVSRCGTRDDDGESVLRRSATSLLNSREMQVYPSPAKDYLSVMLPSGQIQQVSLSDISGKSWQANMTADNRLNIASLAPGVYFIKVTTGDNQVIMKQFVKE